MSQKTVQSLPNPLLGITYTLQRNSHEQVSASTTLLLSAASTQIKSNVESDTWSILRVGDRKFEGKSYIEEAKELAAVDNITRSFYNSKGQDVFDEGLEENDEEAIELPLLAQIVDLQHALNNSNKNSNTSDSNSNTITSEQIINVDTNLPSTKEQEIMSATIELSTDDVEGISNSTAKVKDCGHLILVTKIAFESITPTVLLKDLACFRSITVLYIGNPNHILSWQRWCVHAGATLICDQKRMVHDLANRFQLLSQGIGRQTIYLTAGEEFSISSVTQLTPTPGPIPLETKGRERVSKTHSLMVNLPNDGERWSALISFKSIAASSSHPTLSLDEDGKRLVMVHVDQISYSINIPTAPLTSNSSRKSQKKKITKAISNPLNGMMMPRNDQAMIGASFAQQLSHRIRVIDNLVLSLLRKETRKSVKLLDQLIKISLTLGENEKVTYLSSLKVQMLATGQLKQADKEALIREMTYTPYYLSLNGRWLKSSKL